MVPEAPDENAAAGSAPAPATSNNNHHHAQQQPQEEERMFLPAADESSAPPQAQAAPAGDASTAVTMPPQSQQYGWYNHHHHNINGAAAAAHPEYPPPPPQQQQQQQQLPQLQQNGGGRPVVYQQQQGMMMPPWGGGGYPHYAQHHQHHQQQLVYSPPPPRMMMTMGAPPPQQMVASVPQQQQQQQQQLLLWDNQQRQQHILQQQQQLLQQELALAAQGQPQGPIASMIQNPNNQTSVRTPQVQNHLGETVGTVETFAAHDNGSKQQLKQEQHQQHHKQARQRSSLQEAARRREAAVVTRNLDELGSEQHRAWVASILGREWEIYWKQDSCHDVAEADAEKMKEEEEEAANEDATNMMETEESAVMQEPDAAATTTAAKGQPVVLESATKTEGEEDDHDDHMPLDQLLNKVKKETEDAMDPERGKNNDNVRKEDDDDEEEESVFEEDWYDGTIRSFESLRRAKDNESLLFFYFNVSFVGDDTTYEMVVSPETLRPSARAWIRRTRAILKQGPDEPPPDWESSLPLDTRSLEDEAQLEAIQKRVEQEFPVQQTAVLCQCGNDEEFQKRRREHAFCCRLVFLIRSQLFLRSRLAPIESDNASASTTSADENDDDEIDPTEFYVDFLAQCLRDLEHACQWHFKCWKLLYRIFSADDFDVDEAAGSNAREPSSLSKAFLVEQCLSPGRLALSTLLSNKDLSVKAAKTPPKGRKRPSPPPSSQDAALNSPSRRRRAKRRRQSRTFSEIWMVPTGSVVGDYYSREEEEEDLLTLEIIERFVETVCQADLRWYTRFFGNMLQNISSLIAQPFVRWERRAQFFLGERETLDVKASEGETSAEDMEDDASISNDENESGFGRAGENGCGKRRFVNYEEIESLIDSANQSRVLKSFSLTAYLEKLDSKLKAIDSFEQRAWDLIMGVLDDPGTESRTEPTLLEKDYDPTLRGLKKLSQEATQKDGPIENMNPIGKSSSTLNRKVLENAMVYRSWFLDLVYAESVRERVSFIDNVGSRLSKLPPLPSKCGSSDQNLNSDISAKLDRVSPRVRALTARSMNHIALFHRYQSMLEDERVMPNNSSDRQGFLTLEGAREALKELQALRVISVAEEMLAVRIDTLEWEARATAIMEKPKPAYNEVLTLKQSVDAILEGRSESRAQIVRGKKRHSETESEIRMFGHSDVKGICGPLFTKTVTLFATASAWKERADSVLTVLRAFGNTYAGEISSATTKPPNMVDKRRIDDLIFEYDTLEVDVSDTFRRLTDVQDAAEKWSSSVSTNLENDALSFEECRAFVERIGEERPAGIIVHPTRQVVEFLGELLHWYTTTKKCVSSDSLDRGFLHVQLVTGLQVVEDFCQKRRDHNQFVVPANTMETLVARNMCSKTPRPISVSKLESSPLAKVVLDRMTDECRDVVEGCPLFCLLFSLWAIHVEDFLDRCKVPKESQSNVSLSVAKSLQIVRPSTTCSDSQRVNLLLASLVPESFDNLIAQGDKKEEEARTALADSKSLLRQSSQQMEQVASHLEKLKELYTDSVQCRWSTEGFIALDSALEQNLDFHVKLFGWLVRTFPFPALQSHIADQPQIDESTGKDNRVPYETLVSLHSRMPDSDLVLGDAACITLRVKELYAAARKWQEDISSFTTLTMRGGRRRESADDPDAATTIDLDMVAELCNNPVLLKVAMPRERGIRTMLQSTKRFEVELYEFLDKDYDGESPDRVSIPEGGSLVGEDGTFHLYRLTGSPLFKTLRTSIESISTIANDVLGNTPGKAAFEWIYQAFFWIDSIHSKVTTKATSFGAERLSIPGVEAKNLLERADEIFLNFPEDLRKTLSQHKIFIAATKDGKLTVRSRKGGAHHAVGATIIRWCPFLYNALKHDVSDLEAWEVEVARVSQDFLSIRKFAEGKPMNDPVVVQQSFGCREDLAQLLAAGAELVVFPSPVLSESCQTLYNNISSYLSNNASREATKRFVHSRYVDGGAVIESRKLLLDSLLARRSALRGKMITDNPDEASNQSLFRNSGRTIFSSALKKRIATLALPEQDTAASHCEVKAWEIENALFDAYQDELGDSQISAEYRDKARALRRSLEDPENLSLCVNVLSGKISPDNLVRMSTDQLANPTVRKDREKATIAARQWAVLTEPSSAADKVSSKSKETQGNPASLPSLEHVPRRRTSRSSGSVSLPPAASKTQVAQRNSNEEAKGMKSAEPDRDLKPASKFHDLLKTASRAKRAPPPPPPSLVDMSMNSASTICDVVVTNTTGGDEFFFTLSDGARSFMANLYAEMNPQNEADGLLPQTLLERGRLTMENFSKFLSDKLKNGRWNTMALRVNPLSEKDAKEHKRFCKEYEGVKKRIAMFSLDDGAKAFLVTPRFHPSARGLTFEKTLFSYIVVLTKKTHA